MGEVISAMRSAGEGSETSHRQRGSSRLIGSSEVMRGLRAEVSQVGSSDATILLSGPTGAGKDNVARALHAASKRAEHRFEAINCGAIPRDLAEAELFGAEAGAFTGATRSRMGRIEAANGGTLFLDEIGELPLELQTKFLRFLETREVERLGGGRPVSVDVRIVAATNVDLEQEVAAGRFRADLYWRLAVIWLDIPPLADRREDIPELLSWFAGQQQKYLRLEPCGASALMAHDWPGNVRELRNFVDRACARGEMEIDAAAVDRLLSPRRSTPDRWFMEGGASCGRQPRKPFLTAAEEVSPVDLKALLAQAEAALIAQALETNGTIAASARVLGLKRTTLVEKIRRMGLKAPTSEVA